MGLISIIMPVRNALPYLTACLDSILQQSYADWELLAVNDNSDDQSESVLLKYASQDQRIYCFQNNGTGIIDALNTGYSYSKGQYITRMDADDIMPSIKLERLCGLLRNSEKGILSTGKVKYIRESSLGKGFKKYENWLNRLCDENIHYSEIYKECVIPSPCWMMYRKDFDRIGGFDNKTYPEDYDLCFRMYENKITVIPSGEVLHIWRDHEQRASRNDDNYSDNRFLNLKVKYFLRNEFILDEKLIVWGAGKKGKRIAYLLLENNIDFEWITNNNKKIDKHIYGKKIKSTSDLISGIYPINSIILAVANEDEQKKILVLIEQSKSKTKVFKFC